MPRTTIAAVLAILLLFAPAASARPIDTSGVNVMPERITDTGAKSKVMPERITDTGAQPQTSSLAGTTDKMAGALAQEEYYASQGDQLSALTREQESVSASGSQGVAPAEDDNAPWVIVALGIAAAALVAGSLTVVARRTRTRARVAA